MSDGPPDRVYHIRSDVLFDLFNQCFDAMEAVNRVAHKLLELSYGGELPWRESKTPEYLKPIQGGKP
jgi:hypothetical protein